jgi:hypothetical protein
MDRFFAARIEIAAVAALLRNDMWGVFSRTPAAKRRKGSE